MELARLGRGMCAIAVHQSSIRGKICSCTGNPQSNAYGIAPQERFQHGSTGYGRNRLRNDVGGFQLARSASPRSGTRTHADTPRKSVAIASAHTCSPLSIVDTLSQSPLHSYVLTSQHTTPARYLDTHISHPVISSSRPSLTPHHHNAIQHPYQ
jgi:hypothetical protein